MPILELQQTNGMTLKKAFPLINVGIFDFFGDAPIWQGICDNVVMNNTLFFSYGDKIVAPVLAYYMYNDKTPILDVNTLHTVDDTDAAKLAQMILALYGEKWKRFLAINDSEYNPLNNYDMTEKEAVSASGVTNDALSYNRSNTRSNAVTNAINSVDNAINTGTGTYAGSDNITANASQVSNETQSADGGASIYAFNSTDAVPTNETDAKSVLSKSDVNKQDNATTSANTTSTSETRTGKRDETSKRVESESGKDIENQMKTGTKNDTSIRTLTRAGNIGVTTNTQMLKQEREFWNWSFIREIVKDVADFLTIGVY